jgi:RimJ/RimL family protein N-acetyltransferase
VLRAFEPGDAAVLSALLSDPAIARTLQDMPSPMTQELAESWIDALPSLWNQRVAAVFAVELAAESRLVGSVQLQLRPDEGCAELGFWIGRDDWGRGYATEAVRAALAWCHEAGVQRVHAAHDPDNPASGRVLSRAGMRQGPRHASGAVSYQCLVSGFTQ